MDASTIAAIATPPGEGGVSIIRISGSEAADIAFAIFRSHKSGRPIKLRGTHSHRLIYGQIVKNNSEEVIDEAVLGAKIDVPALDGMKSLTIPPGTSSGAKLRLRGLGVPASGEKPSGDLFVVLKIVTPKTIDDDSRGLIREFGEKNPLRLREGLW